MVVVVVVVVVVTLAPLPGLTFVSALLRLLFELDGELWSFMLLFGLEDGVR